MTEDQIIRGCREKDRKAQSDLYHRFASRMFGVCQRYSHSREDAEDVLQIGFIKVFSNIADYHATGSLEGWIRRIMVNTAIDYYRASMKQLLNHSVDVEDLAEQLEDEGKGTGAGEEPYERIDPKAVLKLLQQLPNGYRIVLNLYAVEGHTHKEIARILDISEGSSKSQLFKARKCLKNLMRESHLFSLKDIPVYEKG